MQAFVRTEACEKRDWGEYVPLTVGSGVGCTIALFEILIFHGQPPRHLAFNDLSVPQDVILLTTGTPRVKEGLKRGTRCNFR